jgi:hypothetical protein
VQSALADRSHLNNNSFDDKFSLGHLYFPPPLVDFNHRWGICRKNEPSANEANIEFPVFDASLSFNESAGNRKEKTVEMLRMAALFPRFREPWPSPFFCTSDIFSTVFFGFLGLVTLGLRPRPHSHACACSTIVSESHVVVVVVVVVEVNTELDRTQSVSQSFESIRDSVRLSAVGNVGNKTEFKLSPLIYFAH